MKSARWSRLVLVLPLALVSGAGCTRSGDAGTAAVAAPGVAVAPVVANDPAADDLARLKGDWQIELLIWDGVPDPNAGNGVAYSFEGDKFIMFDGIGNRQMETIRLMPGQNPKAIDCWGDAGQVVPGIYSLENDTLTWCAAGGANKHRPSAFASEPG